MFTLEGRAAPGLYLVGWIGTILGLAILVAILTSGTNGGGAVVLVAISMLLLTKSHRLQAVAGACGLSAERETALREIRHLEAGISSSEAPNSGSMNG